MADPSPASPSPAPANKADKKPRSPVERVIVWGGIAVLGCLTLFEARQKYSYDPTVGQLKVVLKEVLIDGGEPVKLSEVRKVIYGSPLETPMPDERNIYRQIQLKWPSLVKDYRVNLVVEAKGDDPIVFEFNTPGGTETDPAAEPVAKK